MQKQPTMPWPDGLRRNFPRKSSYRFAALTWGTRGDVQPFIAVGTELVRRGHRVTVAARKPYRELIERHGLRFYGMPEDGTEELMTTLANSGKGNTAFMKIITNYQRSLIRMQYRSFWEASEGADVILTKAMSTTPAFHIAERRGLPVFLAHFDPGFVPNDRYCTVGDRIQDRGRLFNRWMGRFMLFSMGMTVWDLINEWRRKQRMPVDWFAKWSRSSFLSQIPTFLTWSPQVLDRPADWPELYVQTGWWRLPRKTAIPRRIREFLREGPPPVYIGFGSWDVHEKTAVTDTVLEAVRMTGNRAILLSGTADARKKYPDGILVVDALPHDAVLPLVKAAVHHGGGGTMGAAVLAGIPSIVIPAFPAAAIWGHLVTERNIGRLIERGALNAGSLAAALREVDRPEVREQARVVGAMAREDGGEKQAADEIERRLRQIAIESVAEPVLRISDVHPTFTSIEYIERLPSAELSANREVSDEETIPEELEEDDGEAEG